MISFIAAIAVILVLSFFMIVAIRNLKGEVDKQIHQDIYRLSSVYYSIIDEKSEELKNLKSKIEYLKELEAGLQTKQRADEALLREQSVFIQEQGNYLDTQFFDTYAYIQNEFHDLAKQAMLARVDQLVHRRRDINVHEFKELLELFDYGVQYEMYTLSYEDQLRVFEVISQNSMAKKRILKRYMQSHEHFEFKSFMDYVRDYIYRHDAMVYVFARTFEEDLAVDEHYVTLCVDESIAEGYKVKYKDQLFDYSLSSGRLL